MTTTTTATWQSLQEKREEYRRLLAESSRDILNTAVKLFFDANPHVVIVGWSIWTPSFNDGDPCVLRVSGEGAIDRPSLITYLQEEKGIVFPDIEDEPDAFELSYQAEVARLQPYEFGRYGFEEAGHECSDTQDGDFWSVVNDRDLQEEIFGDGTTVMYLRQADGILKQMTNECEAPY